MKRLIFCTVINAHIDNDSRLIALINRIDEGLELWRCMIWIKLIEEQ